MLQLEASTADGLEDPHRVKWAEGFRAAQLEGGIPSQRMGETHDREAGYVVVRNPADGVVTLAVDRGSGVGEIKPGSRRQPDFHQEGWPQNGVRQPALF